MIMVTYLDLYRSNIGDAGVQSLIDAMQWNFFIVSINLGWNIAGFSTINKIQPFFDRNKRLAQYHSEVLQTYSAALRLVQQNAKTELIVEAFLLAKTEIQKEKEGQDDLLSCIESYLKIYQTKKKKPKRIKKKKNFLNLPLLKHILVINLLPRQIPAVGLCLRG